MNTIKTLADLAKMKEEMQQKIDLREKGEDSAGSVLVRVAMATCGIASGAKDVFDFFSDELSKRNISAVITQTGCMGYCYAEPTVEITKPGQEPVVYGYVDLKKADEIIEKYIKNGEMLEGIIPVNYQDVKDTK